MKNRLQNLKSKMKFFVCFFAATLVAVSALPDGFLKLTPDPITNALNEMVEKVTTTEAPIIVAETTTEVAVEEKEETSTKPESGHGTVAARTRLVNDLFKDYNKHLIPDSVQVDFGVSLLHFDVLEDKNALDSNVWISEVWTDNRLSWKPEDYDGVQKLSYDSDEVWKPDVTLYNSADHAHMQNCFKTNVVIENSGQISYIPPCKLLSICPLFSLMKEPYGENTCTLKFGSWTFDGDMLDLQFSNNKTQIDLSQLTPSPNFEIVGTTAVRNAKYYVCCDEPYPDLTYNITVRRSPGEELFKQF